MYQLYKSTGPLIALKTIFLFPLMFHTFNGFRHLVSAHILNLFTTFKIIRNLSSGFKKPIKISRAFYF